MTALTLIFIGDLHGHLVPRADVRHDPPRRVGGLARLYALIERIRGRAPASLLVNAGDTIQGSAEALFTRGAAPVSVLNRFGIDAFAPGNWDYLYGTERFVELFAGDTPQAPWHAIAANLYYDGPPYAARQGSRVLAPYRTVTLGGQRIGLLGLTTHRGPQAVGPAVTRGFRFGDGDAELAELVPHLRRHERVDLLVLVSEMGLARNIQLARSHPGIDVVLSSDSHELTREPVRLDHGTLLVEPGQDGAAVGELTLAHDADGWRVAWRLHDITDDLPEDRHIAELVDAARSDLIGASRSSLPLNPLSGRPLLAPLDAVIGHTAVALHRAGHTADRLPAVIEGTSHDLIADALRSVTAAEIASLRGFRFGTHVPPGPVRVEDLYHFLPLGSGVASGRVTGRQIREQVERAVDGCLSADPREWTGGWMFAYSGLRLELDPGAPRGHRARRIDVGAADGSWLELDDERSYRYASLYHPQAPGVLNGLKASGIEALHDEAGEAVDAVEVVADYLAAFSDHGPPIPTGRIRLTRPLPAPRFGNPELQPLGGVAETGSPSSPPV